MNCRRRAIFRPRQLQTHAVLRVPVFRPQRPNHCHSIGRFPIGQETEVHIQLASLLISFHKSQRLLQKFRKVPPPPMPRLRVSPALADGFLRKEQKHHRHQLPILVPQEIFQPILKRRGKRHRLRQPAILHQLPDIHFLLFTQRRRVRAFHRPHFPSLSSLLSNIVTVPRPVVKQNKI